RDDADGDHIHAVRSDAARERARETLAGKAVVAPEHHALRPRVLLQEVPSKTAPELLGKLRRQLVRNEPADIVLAEDMHRDGHGRSAPKRRRTVRAER